MVKMAMHKEALERYLWSKLVSLSPPRRIERVFIQVTHDGILDEHANWEVSIVLPALPEDFSHRFRDEVILPLQSTIRATD